MLRGSLKNIQIEVGILFSVDDDTVKKCKEGLMVRIFPNNLHMFDEEFLIIDKFNG